MPSIALSIPLDLPAPGRCQPLFRDVQPYVDLKMYNEFDEATRKGTVTVDVFTYVSPSDAIHALNVWLVQDGLVGYQASGGAEYVHNHVFCGALTNSAWGQQLPLVPGETVRRTFQYEIPDEMYPTYYEDSLDRSFPAVPANMQLVAFVSDVSSTDPLACNLSFTRLYITVLCLVGFNKVANKHENLAVRTSSLIVCDYVQLIKHFLFDSYR